MPEWFFEPWSPSGDSPASSNRQQLAGVGLSSEDLFAREVTQNGTDAAAPKSKRPVLIKISTNTVGGTELKKLLTNLRIVKGSAVLERLTFDPYKKQSINLMLIEDYNTVGLGGLDKAGHADNEADRYVKLCLNVGDNIPGEEKHRGGSYGFGKAVYWAYSDFWTVIFYSRFNPTERTQNHSRRLITVGWYDSFEEKGLRHTGRTWLGKINQDQTTGIPYPTPLYDEEADKFAELLGIPLRRDKTQNGTSILILGSKITEMEKIRNGLELHWWPRILSKELEVELYQNGKKEPPPMPRDNHFLSMHLRCWNILNNWSDTDDNERKFNLTYGSSTLGQLAVRGVPRTEGDQEEDDSIATNSVALVRYPKMVVNYYSPYNTSSILYAGVFVADNGIDNILKESEPPSHNRWDKNSSRIQDDQHKITIVNKTMDKVRSSLRNFLKSQNPPPPETPQSCQALGSRLGKFFAGLKTLPPPPPEKGHKRRFSCNYISGPKQYTNPDGLSFIEAELKVSPNNEILEPGEKILLEIKPHLHAYIDESSPIGTDLPVKIEKEDGEVKEGSVILDIEGDGPSQKIKLNAYPLPDSNFRWQLSLHFEDVGEE